MSFPSPLSSDSTPPPITALVASITITHVRIEASFAMAFFGLLVYYWMLRMDKEVKYIWPGPITTVGSIFYANRCIGLVGGVSRVVYNGFRDQSTLRCRITFWAGTISNWLIIVLLDYILILRVAALYGQNKLLDICLKLLLFAQSACALGILINYTLVENAHAFDIARGITICTLDEDPPRELVIAWALPTVNGFLLLCLTLYKAYVLREESDGFKGFRLVKIIAKDQIMYYCFLIAIAMLRIATFFAGSANKAVYLVSASSPVLLCIIGDHLLINLKEAFLCDGTGYWVDDFDGSGSIFEFPRFS